MPKSMSKYYMRAKRQNRISLEDTRSTPKDEAAASTDHLELPIDSFITDLVPNNTQTSNNIALNTNCLADSANNVGLLVETTCLSVKPESEQSK